MILIILLIWQFLIKLHFAHSSFNAIHTKRFPSKSQFGVPIVHLTFICLIFVAAILEQNILCFACASRPDQMAQPILMVIFLRVNFVSPLCTSLLFF